MLLVMLLGLTMQSWKNSRYKFHEFTSYSFFNQNQVLHDNNSRQFNIILIWKLFLLWKTTLSVILQVYQCSVAAPNRSSSYPTKMNWSNYTTGSFFAFIYWAASYSDISILAEERQRVNFSCIQTLASLIRTIDFVCIS